MHWVFNKKWGKVNENVADCTMVLAKVTETLGWPTSSFLMSSKILGVTFGKKHISGVLLSLLNFSLKSVNSDLLSHKIYVSTTLLRQWGFRHWLPFSWTTLRGKHCRHPIAVMRVVDTFGQRQLLENSWSMYHHLLGPNSFLSAVSEARR